MRTALITGASGAIGSEIARALAGLDYAVALHYHRNKEAVTALFAELKEAGFQALCVRADLRHAVDVNRMAAMIHERLGKVSALVNNAGAALPQRLLTDCSEADYEYVFDVNMRGVVHCTKAVIPDMLALGQGAIVNISSVFGVVGGSCEVLYSASKAAVIGFSKALAKELAPSDIRVNCVTPGFVPSAMNTHLSPEAVELLRQETPLQCLGTPDDVAQAVCYLIQAPFVTGQVIGVDGGLGIY